MLKTSVLLALITASIISKRSSAVDLWEKLKLINEEVNDDCFAYADASQLQLLYEMEEKDRPRWNKEDPFGACLLNSSIVYTDVDKYKYCQRKERPFVIDSENLDKIAFGYKIDIVFRSSHNSQWCIKIHQWLSPSMEEHLYTLSNIRRRESIPSLSGLKRVTQTFHAKWADHTAHLCPPMNSFNDEQIFCMPLDGTLTMTSTVPDVQSITENEMNNVRDAIFEVIDHERIVGHYRLGCHKLAFFYGHRSYLSCVRNHVHRKGIRLPIWNPTSGYVPPQLKAVKPSPFACLSSIRCQNGWFDIPFASDIRYHIDLPTALKPENICSTSYEELYNITFILHHQIHNFVNGIFATFDSPASMLFYIYHNWIDIEILRRWESCSTNNMNMRKTLIQSMIL